MQPWHLQNDCIKFNYSDDLSISVGLNGVTILKSNLLHSRFSGSKSFIVNSKGCLQKKEVPEKKKVKHKLSGCSKSYTVNKKKVVSILSNFINCMNDSPTLFFYTITFPLRCPDDVAYRVLNSWLTSLRTGYSLKNYLWVAERQINKTIHFHIAIKEFLPIRLINNIMKKLLHNEIRKCTLNWNHLACSKYNGVDISKDRITKKVTNYALSANGKTIANYMSKYMIKGTELFKRQAWQCSKSLSSIFTKYNMSYDEFESRLINEIDCDYPMFETDFYIFYKWRKTTPKEISNLLKLVNSAALKQHSN